jgi:hypothetical protein
MPVRCLPEGASHQNFHDLPDREFAGMWMQTRSAAVSTPEAAEGYITRYEHTKVDENADEDSSGEHLAAVHEDDGSSTVIELYIAV